MGRGAAKEEKTNREMNSNSCRGYAGDTGRPEPGSTAGTGGRTGGVLSKDISSEWETVYDV